MTARGGKDDDIMRFADWVRGILGSPPMPSNTSDVKTTVTTIASGDEPPPAALPNSKLKADDAVRTELLFEGWHYKEPKNSQAPVAFTLLLPEINTAATLRAINHRILFRLDGAPDLRAARFLMRLQARSTQHVSAEDITSAQFIAALNAGETGRVLLYTADFMQKQQCARLFFAPDGTGFELQLYSLTDFRWNDLTTLTWPQLLNADPEALRPLCAQIFEKRVNPCIANPYLDPCKLETIPHRFECGSEEELRRITVAIAQSDPLLWKDATGKARSGIIGVAYRARTPTKGGYMRKTWRQTNASRYPTQENFVSGRLQSLCDLAFRLNTFTGIQWTPRTTPANRLGSFDRRVHNIVVEVQPPSMHEQAEALLLLNEWLTGKVSDARRLQLLGVNADGGQGV